MGEDHNLGELLNSSVMVLAAVSLKIMLSLMFEVVHKNHLFLGQTALWEINVTRSISVCPKWEV